MTNTKPTLIIMAAGMGSRYGGLKQLDQFGPAGETIMDYSIYDAHRAGFGKVVFIIRESFAKEFEQLIVEKIKDFIPVEWVFQEMDKLPSGFTSPPERSKPWGTAHAALMAKEVVNENFAIINGDDFYGLEAFEAMGTFLENAAVDKSDYALVGYPLGATVSKYGAVARGVCEHDSNLLLTKVTERTNIRYQGEDIVFTDEQNNTHILPPTTAVSMNFWGFSPKWFQQAEELFIDFLKTNGQHLTAEFYIPFVVDQLLKQQAARVQVLQTQAKWFGVTYKEDKPQVQQELQDLIRLGHYPPALWEK